MLSRAAPRRAAPWSGYPILPSVDYLERKQASLPPTLVVRNGKTFNLFLDTCREYQLAPADDCICRFFLILVLDRMPRPRPSTGNSGATA